MRIKHPEPIRFRCSCDCDNTTTFVVYIGTTGHCVNCGTFYYLNTDGVMVTENHMSGGPREPSHMLNVDWPA